MRLPKLVALAPVPFALALGVVVGGSDQAGKDAELYAAEIEKLNAAHAAKPKGSEEELAARLSSKAEKALDRLIGMEDSEEVLDALLAAGETALLLDRLGDFERVRARLEGSEQHAARLGVALTRSHFQLRGLGGLDQTYLERFADLFEAVLTGYDELFGFHELSKVPGKKLRVRIHLEETITRPPHFAPELPYHSEIDFPVVDAKELRSPTADEGEEPFAGISDARWRSLAKLREEAGTAKPSLESQESVLALLLALHDAVGSRAIGDAINYLDEKDTRLRVNRVRYYTFRELQRSFEETLKDKEKAKTVKELLDL